MPTDTFYDRSLVPHREPTDFSHVFDPDRLDSLASYAVLDAPPDESLDRLTRLAVRLLHAPAAMVSLVDDHRQFFASQTGQDEPWASLRETPLADAFCKYVVARRERLVVVDARSDPIVSDCPGIRSLGTIAYLGIPLVSSDGGTLGSFCAVHPEPRAWSDEDVATMEELARSVVTELEHRRAMLRLERTRRENRDILERMDDAVLALDRDWRIVFVNTQTTRLLDAPAAALVGQPFGQAAPSLAIDALCRQLRRALASGHSCSVELPLDDRWHEASVYPSPTGLSIYLRDVTLQKAAQERVRFQAHLLDVVEQAVIATDPEGRVLYWNAFAERLYGWTAVETAHRPLSQLIVPEPARAEFDGALAVVERRRSWSGELLTRRRDGTTFWTAVTRSPVETDDGAALAGVITVARDVTESRLAQAALRESEERFRSAFDDAATGMAIVGVDGRFLRVNRALAGLLGATEAALLAGNAARWVHADDSGATLAQARRALAGEIEHWHAEQRVLHGGGHRWVLLGATLLRGEDGAPLYFIVQLQDIEARKRLELALAHDASHDPLTGLANRALFQHRLERACERARDTGDRLAVLYLDLDGFKAVNDRLGHARGDALLVEVAAALCGAVREGDTVARLGGDEFAILLEHRVSPQGARRCAERVRAAVRAVGADEAARLPITASVGIALAHGPAAHGARLLEQADAAMYRAKRAGRDTVAPPAPG